MPVNDGVETFKAHSGNQSFTAVTLSDITLIEVDAVSNIEVYDLNGRIMFKGVSLLKNLGFPTGFYIVKTKNITTKLAIR